MLTLHQMQESIFEKDQEKEKEALLKEAEKLRQKGHNLVK